MKIFIYSAKNVEDNDISLSANSFGDERCKKITSKKLPGDQKLSYAAGMAIKKALWEYDIDYKLVEISLSTHGKPYIKKDEILGLGDVTGDIYFNASHSGDYAVAVAGRKELGIDIESIRSCRDSIVRRCFTENEKNMMDSADDRDLMFTIIWTLKESYLKAVGDGITRELRSVNTYYDLNNGMGGVLGKDGETLAYIRVCRELQGYVISVCSFDKIENISLCKDVYGFKEELCQHG